MPATRTLVMRTLTLAVMMTLATPAWSQDSTNLPSREAMWQMLQAQQEQLEAMQARIEQLQNQTHSASATAPAAAEVARIEQIEARLAQNEERIEATGGVVETALSDAGLGSDGWWQRTTLGGYGEMHYNGGNSDEIDFHRFVLFAGHRFNDWLRLQSELEVEHADTEKNGAVELEQAFLEADLTSAFGWRLGENDRHSLRAGVFLVPVGILNETHEPPTFFGVERNRIENQIIPTTWREGGVALNGTFGQGFSYDLATHSGLQVDSNFAIRGGRKSVSEAPAEDVAYTGRLKWKGIPGVELGVSGQYQQDVTQGARGIDATLLEAHADILRNGFGLRALYAHWDIEGAADVKALGRDSQYGWYVEPSYRFAVATGTLGFFGRHERWDTQSGLKGVDTRFDVTSFGFNYWPVPEVVFKLDYQFESTPNGVQDDDRLNLGIGYQF
ncbi:MAG: hypothetical protein Q8L45_07065 [Xanthomonadaceae bacterium]|nr:hypothetical protein [Xanthomonadaceae bacterium]